LNGRTFRELCVAASLLIFLFLPLQDPSKITAPLPASEGCEINDREFSHAQRIQPIFPASVAAHSSAGAVRRAPHTSISPTPQPRLQPVPRAFIHRRLFQRANRPHPLVLILKPVRSSPLLPSVKIRFKNRSPCRSVAPCNPLPFLHGQFPFQQSCSPSASAPKSNCRDWLRPSVFFDRSRFQTPNHAACTQISLRYTCMMPNAAKTSACPPDFPVIPRCTIRAAPEIRRSLVATPRCGVQILELAPLKQIPLLGHGFSTRWAEPSVLIPANASSISLHRLGTSAKCSEKSPCFQSAIGATDHPSFFEQFISGHAILWQAAPQEPRKGDAIVHEFARHSPRSANRRLRFLSY